MYQLRSSLTLRRSLTVAVASLGCQRAVPLPLPDPASLRDSVQVGYGAQARRDVTGAIGSVSGDVAQRSSPMTLADMMNGRVPGVEVWTLPSGRMSVRIRGSSTLMGDAEPLFILDGVPLHGSADVSLRDIDPRDVQSIDVLKDASAAALYGSRGANGVILITMKHPR